MLTLLVVLTIAGVEPAGEAPGEAVEFDGHAYLLVDEVEDLSWEGARRQCESWGGHLAVVTSEEEFTFIADLCDGRYMYLGGTDSAEEGTWAWIDGSPWEFTRWMDGQPNDYGGSEDYLATYDDGEWVDVEGSGKAFWMPTGFICEWVLPGPPRGQVSHFNIGADPLLSSNSIDPGR